MRELVYDVLVPVGIICGLLAVVGGLVLLGGNWASSVSCASTANAIGVEHKYSLMMGCIIKTPKGEWVPLKNYRAL
jgi:flagellar motor component MotA